MDLQPLIDSIVNTGAEFLEEDFSPHSQTIVFKPTDYNNFQQCQLLADQFKEDNSLVYDGLSYSISISKFGYIL